jgi:hypothetical protein
MFAAVGMLSQAYLGSSVKLLVIGSVIEAGRRLCQWLMVRLRLRELQQPPCFFPLDV